jgi:hypothetical protein
MKYLFVGGPKHGEQIELPDNRHRFLVPEMPNFTARYFDPTDQHIDDYRIRTVEYERTDVGSDRIIYIARRTNR